MTQKPNLCNPYFSFAWGTLRELQLGFKDSLFARRVWYYETEGIGWIPKDKHE